MKVEFDIVLYGATSFVGQIVARYLLSQYGSDGELRWAIAGRSLEKLESLNASLAADLPVIVAEASAEDPLRNMVERTSVVISTVGPYALYGSELVAECVRQGKAYCDLTGEAQWIARMITAHQQEAESTGARIVNSCGFDSIPSDLGVWYTQQQFIERHGHPASRIKMRVKAMKGGASGGTIASMLNLFKEASGDPALRKALRNPYSICPDALQKGPKQPEVLAPQFEAESGQWLGPFVMAAINTRIVQRSHALMGRCWGEDFLYDEAMWMGAGFTGRLKAAGLAAGMAGLVGVAAVGPMRNLLEKMLPSPGEGPTPEQQKNGFFDLRFFAADDEGGSLSTKVTGKGDPGYGSTAKMLGEAAVCLAKDSEGVVAGGGLWTPATAFPKPMFDRLQRNAEMKFEIL